MDWIVTNIFSGAPLLDDHSEAQERASNQSRSFARTIAICLDRQKWLGRPLTASSLGELVISSGVSVPGSKDLDDESVAKSVGWHLARVFNEVAGDNTIRIDGYSVRRLEQLVNRPDGKGSFKQKSYIFRKSVPENGNPQ